MIRSDVIRKLTAYLGTAYSGPVLIVAQEDDGELSPPYAIVRVGTAESIGEGQVDIWQMNVLVAVFHDADTTSAETAEAQAEAVFAELADPDEVEAGIAPLVMSWWGDPSTMEASIAETRWQHVASYTLVVAPPAPD